MKKILSGMIGMFLLIVWPGGSIWGALFSKMVGGGVSESFLFPIYGGLILLTGVVIGCGVVLLEEIRSLRKEIEALKKELKSKESQSANV